jgi:hypothetical protein
MAYFKPAEEVIPLARAYAEKCVEIDPLLPDGHYTVAEVHAHFAGQAHGQ